ncbi:TolC family outer membrane protein [Aurantivibrio plasticivorans]
MDVITKRALATVVNVAMGAAFSMSVGAQQITSLGDAVREAVNNNPEVKASWHEFEAAREEVKIAKGGFYPSVDLEAQSGKVDSDNPAFLDDKYRRTTSRIAVTQNVFNGGQTWNEVKKLNQQQYARYYELREVSESLAFEAVAAYLDVIRFRRLVKLAEDNYIEHRLIFNDIEQRAQAGISRSVDLEQAKARLALAESNLITETTNLYDVSRRYTRLLGQVPADELEEPTIDASAIPAARMSALSEAYDNSPLLLSASYNYLSAQTEYKEKKSPYMPKIDLRARKDTYDDSTNGLANEFDETVVEVVLTYNLFRGGSDRATRRMFRQRSSARYEQRQQACRDVTQSVSIAFNDIQSLLEQKRVLARNLEAIEKVRTAYRNQFDIGQRTLLDLLDTENEFFDVSRSHVNAAFDLQVSQASVLAGMGRLIEVLAVEGLDMQASQALDLAGEEDVANFCQLKLERGSSVDREEVLARVLASDRLKVKPIVVPAPVPVVEEAPRKNVSFRFNVQYQNGSAALMDSYMSDIKIAADYLKENPNVKGIIEGHTDSVGASEYNMQLSQARAETLKSVLVRDYNIDESRLTAKGFGEQVPIATNATEQGRRENRRVLMVIVDE